MNRLLLASAGILVTALDAVINAVDLDGAVLSKSETIEQHIPGFCHFTNVHSCAPEYFDGLQALNCCSPELVLHCQKPGNEETALLACVPLITCNKGEFAKLFVMKTQNDTTVAWLECQPCRPGTFQKNQTHSDQFKYDDGCQDRKTTCTDESWTYCYTGSASEDDRCACNYKNGFAPDWTKRNNLECRCFDRNSPCGPCNPVQCEKGEELSEDFICRTRNNSSINANSSDTDYLSTEWPLSSSFSPAGEDVVQRRKSCIIASVVATVAVVFIIVLVILGHKWYRARHGGDYVIASNDMS